ncbi:hypothetical protein [Rhizobium mongolense]|uniref:Uncharacterized protein n=1 Tax=Rhizobium mongolense TaxID=57676 RepID=A0ABR6IS46_9HYPH|nr:hypothetical protein [Rhizobium mongolense]MBB4230403.1 hypothetical protein [Rhizobium mongolense]
MKIAIASPTPPSWKMEPPASATVGRRFSKNRPKTRPKTVSANDQLCGKRKRQPFGSDHPEQRRKSSARKAHHWRPEKASEKIETFTQPMPTPIKISGMASSHQATEWSAKLAKMISLRLRARD